MTIRSLRWPPEARAIDTPAMDHEALRTVLFRHREALLVVMSVPVVAAALRGGGVDAIEALIGAVIAAKGVLLRLWAVRHIGRGARVFHAHARAGLISSGPYRWTRNPLYLAAALMLGGLGLIAGAGWLAVALLFATLLAYTPVVRVEERALLGLLGDEYRDYIVRVPRWVGLRRPYPGPPPRGALVPWRDVFRREKRLVPGTLAAMVAIAATRHEWLPLPALADRVELALGIDAIVIVAAGTAIVLAVNAIKVEQHQERRRIARAAARRES
jgi:protein-S-isoprenylcysteine O-methyltransferase Ste14